MHEDVRSVHPLKGDRAGQWSVCGLRNLMSGNSEFL